MNTKLVKIAKGTGIAAAGAALTYLAETIPGVDFGVYTPYVTAALAVVVNALRQLLKNDLP